MTHTWPIRPAQFVANLVYNANGSDVTDVFVDGRRVIADRRATQIDAAEARRQCQSAAERTWARASHLFAGA